MLVLFFSPLVVRVSIAANERARLTRKSNDDSGRWVAANRQCGQRPRAFTRPPQVSIARASLIRVSCFALAHARATHRISV